MKDFNCKVLLSSGDVVFDSAVADSFYAKLSGIMFKRQFPYSALLFRDAFWIHSFFCFVKFHIVFLDKNFNVLENIFNVEPNKILNPVWGAKYVIEYFDDGIKFNKGDTLKLEFYEKKY